jgi:hypothetical protein
VTAPEPPPHATPPGDPRAYYAARAAAAADDERRARDRARWLSAARLLVAAATLLCGWLLRRTPVAGPVAVAVGVAAYALLVRTHRTAAAALRRAREARAACADGLARVARDWAAMPRCRLVASAFASLPPRVDDLGLLGRGSLAHLLDVAQPSLGGLRLVDWLVSDPPPLAELAARQRSVRALRERPELLVDAAVLGRHAPHAEGAPQPQRLEAVRAWCGAPVRPLPPALGWAATLGAALALLALVTGVALDAPRVATAIGALAVVLNVGAAGVARRWVGRLLAGVQPALATVRAATGWLHRLEAEGDVPGRFGELQALLREGRAAHALTELERLLRWDEARFSPMLHAVLNAAVGYDAHLARALARWRADRASRLPAWLDALAEAQALAALGTLAYENPTWRLPVVHERAAAPFLRARACGHPLLAPGRMTPNDARLGGAGTLLVVSGSNMSGKTTHLRALGLNALLAYAGGPACARRLLVRRARVRTSVRVDDDLAAGMSLFYAEVARLRDVVRAAEEPSAPPVLYLLDEILHGTNAADRHAATCIVLRRLMQAGAAGAVTTHDPAVADDVRAADGARGNVEEAHFTEELQRGPAGIEMRFDYVLRPGPATGRNALAILAMMGLDGAPAGAAPRARSDGAASR